MQISLLPIGGYLVVALLAALLLGVLFIGPTRRKTSPRQRRVLLALRLGVVLLVLFGMLRPTIVYTSVRKQSATLVLLADRSRSMLIEDAFGDRSRWESLVDVFGDSLPVLDDLARDFEVKLYTYAEEPEPVEFQGKETRLPETPDGDQTAIGSALEEVLRREAGKRLIGVVLLSDGSQRANAPYDVPPQLPTRRLAEQDYPLYTVAFGQASARGDARDVALRDLAVPEYVFVKNQLAVRGNTRIDGFVNRDVPVQLLFETKPGEMTVVDSTNVRAPRDGEQLPVELSYVPQIPGEFKVTLKATQQPGELVTTNNELSTFVTVRKGGLNVLYLEGAIRPEQKFVRRTLDASPNIKVDYVRIDAERPETRPVDLAERFEPGRYDVYLIGDLDSQAFEGAELESLAEAVRGGAGFMMLGGIHSFGPGGYQRTALADVLPIEISAFERQNFGEPISTDLHLPGTPKMQPTPLGEAHFVMRLADPKRNRQAWAELPPLDGANRFRGLKPGANVLAESTTGEPLLVAHDYGLGRVVGFAGDSTWRWALQGHEEAHKRFWRQMILWLARKDDAGEGEVWIQLDPRRFLPGQRVEFTAGARSAEGEELTDAQFEAEVVLPDESRRPLRMHRRGTDNSGTFLETQAPGDYAILVTARQGNREVGTARARFLVMDQDLELDNPVADPTLMANLAEVTGGEALAPEQLPSLLQRLRDQPPPLEIETLRRETLWDRWPFLLLLAGLLCTEWYLRKKWGLV